MVIGRLQRCVFFGANREIRDNVYVWWLREALQIGQTFIPLCEKVI